jgi:hypothetical protein
MGLVRHISIIHIYSIFNIYHTVHIVHTRPSFSVACLSGFNKPETILLAHMHIAHVHKLQIKE